MIIYPLLYHQAEKFRCASRLATKLASLASEVSGSSFTARCNILDKIISSWEDDKEVEVHPKGSENATEQPEEVRSPADTDEQGPTKASDVQGTLLLMACTCLCVLSSFLFAFITHLYIPPRTTKGNSTNYCTH